MNKEEIQKIISSNDFDKFIGQIENDWMDFKDSPYVLKTNKQKVEFAKDVSSFANSMGGFILIGFKTKKYKYKDKVVSISPISENLVNIKQYKDIISSWIIPRIDCDIYWVKSDSASNKGIVIIQVSEHSDPIFLVAKTVDEEKTIGHFFGHFKRRGDEIIHLDVHEMHYIFKQGYFIQNIFSITKKTEEAQEKSDEIRVDDSLPEKE